uniref:tape measure protein n=1 Tax=Ndongobacter massiliensis TaxID=1871025 RepID=UPI000930921B|nr:tape measure protein [Ndongobacter massiliensis]
MADGQVVIRVIADDTQAKKLLGTLEQLNKTGSSRLPEQPDTFKKPTEGAKKFSVGMLAAQAAMKGVQMVSDALGAAIGRFDTMNKYPKVMEKMGFSAGQSSRSIRQLSKGIEGLPTRLDEVVSTAQGLASMTGDINKATKTTLALNNAFLASGASSEDASRGLIQYTQMLAKGQPDMQSWRTLQETMPYALQKTAESFGFAGTSAQIEFYGALKNGKITFDQFNDRLGELNDGVGGFAEMALEGSAGIQTSFQNIKTAVINGTTMILTALDNVSKAITGKSIAQNLDLLKVVIKRTFSDIAKTIESLTPVLKVVFGAFMGLVGVLHTLEPVLWGLVTAWLAFKVITTVSGWISTAIAIWKSFQAVAAGNATLLSATPGLLTQVGVAMAGATTFTGALTAGLGALKVGISALLGPIGLVALAIGGLVAIGKGFWDWLHRVSPEIEELGNAMSDASKDSQQLADDIDSAVDAWSHSKEKIEANAKTTKQLAQETQNLARQEKLTNAEKKLLKENLEELNKTIPGLNAVYDDQAHSLNLTNEQIEKYIDLNTADEGIADSKKKIAEIDEQLADLAIQRKTNTEELTAAQEKLSDSRHLSMGDIDLLNERIEELTEKNGLLAESETQAAEQKRIAEQEKIDAANAYAEAEESVKDRVITSRAELTENQQQVFDRMKDMYKSFEETTTDMFGRIEEKSAISVSEMIENLRANQEAVANWSENLAILADRGVNQGILEQLRNMGPEGAAYVRELVNASDEELEELNTEFQKGGETARVSLENEVRSAGGTVPDEVTNMVAQTGSTLASEIAAANFAGAGQNIAQGTADGIKQGTGKATGATKDMADKIQSSFRGSLDIHSPSGKFKLFGQDTMEGLTIGIKGAAPKAVAATKSVATSVISGFRSCISAAASAGRDTGNGFYNGLAATRWSIYSLAQGIADNVASTIRRALQIHSPSRVTKLLGRYTGEGFAEGLEGEIRSVGALSEKLADAALPRVDLSGAFSFAKPGAAASTTNSTTNHNERTKNVFYVEKIIWNGKEDIRRTMDEMGWIVGQENWRLQNA